MLLSENPGSGVWEALEEHTVTLLCSPLSIFSEATAHLVKVIAKDYPEALVSQTLNDAEEFFPLQVHM